MRRNKSRLLNLLDLNGEIDNGRSVWERYNLSAVLEGRSCRRKEIMDLLSIGDIFIEKFKRIRALNGRPEKFGISPYGEKIFRKHCMGRILGRTVEHR